MNGPLPYTSGLARPTDPFTRHDVVYTRQINDKAISMRPVYLKQDMDLLRKWVKKEYSRPRFKYTPYDEIIQTLIHVAHSDFAQAFTVLEKNAPICQVEVCNALYKEVSLYAHCKEGDYIVHFPLPYEHTIEFRKDILTTCVDYFLLHKEVRRVFAIGEDEDRELLDSTGFSNYWEGEIRKKRVRLYLYGEGMG